MDRPRGGGMDRVSLMTSLKGEREGIDNKEGKEKINREKT